MLLAQSMAGTVGPPFCGVQFRLESVPEMGYDALDPAKPSGEILMRSAQLFSGYHKSKARTSLVAIQLVVLS